MSEAPEDWSSAASTDSDRKPESKALRWVLLGCGVFSLGVMGLFFAGMFAALSSLDDVSGDYRVILESSDVVREHLGEIDKIEYDWMRTADDPDPDAEYMRVVGSLASGDIRMDAALDSDGEPFIYTGTLQVDSGGIYRIGTLNYLREAILEQLRENRLIRERIGEVEVFEIDFYESNEYESDDEFVYDIQGSKGSGYVWVRSFTLEDDTEEIDSAILTLENGTELSLSPGMEHR